MKKHDSREKRRPVEPSPSRPGDVPVRDLLLQRNDWAVPTIAPRASVLEALARMEEIDAGALIVTEGHEILGMLSERDCARKVLLEGRDPGRTEVAAVMTRAVCMVKAGMTVDECLDLMIRRRIRHLPVLFGTYLVGCVTLRDLVIHLRQGVESEAGEEEAADRSAARPVV